MSSFRRPAPAPAAYPSGVRVDDRPVVRAWVEDRSALPADTWPMTIPAVAQVVAEGIDPGDGVTLLVGENGSGKSTLTEGLAIAFGLSPEGGTPFGQHTTRASESPLGRALRIQRGVGASRYGFFLRAETMHGWLTFLEANPSGSDPVFHEMSHGESVLAVLRARVDLTGFTCLDEPEAGLSFQSTLGLLGPLDDIARAGGQVVCATHSPILAAMPGARILEVGPWGLRETAWDDLEVVQHWRAFLDGPDRYLRHLLG